MPVPTNASPSQPAGVERLPGEHICADFSPNSGRINYGGTLEVPHCVPFMTDSQLAAGGRAILPRSMKVTGC